ncbi:MAG: hypothetical protein F9B45_32440 [Phycisphaera sp. RhM]|nr:hypothetical protein [Phycisphaera sp. RhM]
MKSWFDWCAVDSAEEDNPTPVYSDAEDRRLTWRLLIGTPEFPLAVSFGYTVKPRRWFQLSPFVNSTNQPLHAKARSRRQSIYYMLVRRASVNGAVMPF